MSRGRRHHSRVAGAPRPAATPDAKALLSAGIAGLVADALANPDDLRVTERVTGGGLAGDTELHAGDLLALARLSAHSDAADAADATRGILERAEAHERTHLELITAAAEHPRSSGAWMWGRYNLPHGRESREAAARVLTRSRERLAEIAAALKDPAALRDAPLRGPFADLAVRRILAPGVAGRLASEPTGALALAKEAAALMSPCETSERLALATVADAKAAARLAAAREAAGGEVDVLHLIAHEPVTALGSLQADHLAGDVAERKRARHRRPGWREPGVPYLMDPPPDIHRGAVQVLAPAADAASARARARGLLRDPEAHEARSYGYRLGRHVSVPVTEGAFSELAREDPDAEVVLCRAHGKQATVRLGLTRRARIGEHDIQVRYLLELGTSRRTSLAALTSELVPDDLPQPSAVFSWPTGRGAHPVSRGHRHDPPGPQLTLDELLGPDACDHRDGRWELNEARSAACLSCPRCLRRRVAIVPLHRIPRADPLWDAAGDDPNQYLTRERVRRALVGEPPLPAATTVEDLRRADGLADLRPETYAVAPAAPPAPRRPAGGLAGALAGRRA